MTEMTNLRVLMMHVLVFHVTLNRAQSRSAHKRFFAAMRRAMAARGYVVSQWHGLCLVIPMQEQEPLIGRHHVVNWLIDQSETVKVTVNSPRPLDELLAGRYTLSDEEGNAITPHTEGVTRELLRRVVEGALVQALQRLQRLAAMDSEQK